MEINDKLNTIQTIKPKKITYKSMEEVPLNNPIKGLCNFFLPTKMRFCKFEPMKDSEFCNHHNSLKGEKCKECNHFVFTENLEKHIFICNKTKQMEILQSQPWYKKNINLLRNIDQSEKISTIDLDVFLKKLVSTHEALSKEYKEYITSLDFNHVLKGGDLYVNNYLLSGMSFNENDLNHTNQLARLEKHSTQGDALMTLMKDFKLLSNSKSDKIYFIEFGAGKGGLTEKVIETTKDTNKYILLERSGVRYKKDKCSSNTIRYRTDILDFDLKFITKDKDTELIGIAKHICGCALDMSITSLLNVKENFKGLCFASCCHHLGNINNFLGYEKLIKDFGFSNDEIRLLFKCSSWLFEDIEEKLSEKYEKIISTQKEKKRYGLIAKYIIDLSRCFYLISQGKTVFYIKYCSNTITTENNAIVCI